MAILTSTIRLAFGMARDDQLPFSKTMAKVNPRLHTPVGACIIVGALALIPFIQFAGAAVIAVGATASIYLSYLLGNLAVLRARTKGWPRTAAPFKLGGWGLLVNIVAVVWGLAMMLNFLWPSSAVGTFDAGTASDSNYLRIFSNPKPVQSDYYVQGQPLLNFHIEALNKIPIIWTVFTVIFIAGALYYWLAQKKKPWEPVVPSDEDLSGIVTSA
jgi:amino acid transporter